MRITVEYDICTPKTYHEPLPASPSPQGPLPLSLGSKDGLPPADWLKSAYLFRIFVNFPLITPLICDFPLWGLTSRVRPLPHPEPVPMTSPCQFDSSRQWSSIRHPKPLPPPFPLLKPSPQPVGTAPHLPITEWQPNYFQNRMDGLIYYVGGRQDDSKTERRSSSCRKTERTPSHGRRKLTPQTRDTPFNRSLPQKQPRLTLLPKENRPALPPAPTRKIRFRKVEQSHQRDLPFLRAISPQQLQNFKLAHSRTTPNLLSDRVQQLLRPPPPPAPPAEDPLADYRGVYKLQPGDRLFLCDRCLQFLPCIEIRTHHGHCLPPTRLPAALAQWTTLLELLRGLLLREPSDPLARLTDLMQWYVATERSPGQNHLLYSPELTRILSYRSVVSLQTLHRDDLFGLIESLGDRIETAKGENSPFWRIC